MGIGEAMALGSAATWAVGVILARQLGVHLPPLALNLLKNGLVLAVLAPVALVLHAGAWPSLPAEELAIVVASGVIGIALADTLYFRALNELGAGRMGVIGNLYSPLVLLLGFLFLDERLGAGQWLGFALVGLGVLLVSRPPGEWRTHPQHTVRGVVIGLAAIALMAIAIGMVKRTLETQPLLWVTALRLAGACSWPRWSVRDCRWCCGSAATSSPRPRWPRSSTSPPRCSWWCSRRCGCGNRWASGRSSAWSSRSAG